MLDKLEELYTTFLAKGLAFQQQSVFPLSHLHVITGTTAAGKSTLMQKYNLPSLISYKTSPNSIQVRHGQLAISPEKFAKKFAQGDFFDVYKLNDTYYGFAIRDYFVVMKQFGAVYIDVSLENLLRGIYYDYKSLTIVKPSSEQLRHNIITRAQERGYSDEKTEEIRQRQESENAMVPSIIQRYPNHTIITSIDDFIL